MQFFLWQSFPVAFVVLLGELFYNYVKSREIKLHCIIQM